MHHVNNKLTIVKPFPGGEKKRVKITIRIHLHLILFASSFSLINSFLTALISLFQKRIPHENFELLLRLVRNGVSRKTRNVWQKKRIKNKEQRKWSLKVPKKRQAKRKLKTLPVARTGSRSKTWRSEISLGSFSYISCLSWSYFSY